MQPSAPMFEQGLTRFFPRFLGSVSEVQANYFEMKARTLLTHSSALATAT